MKVINETLVEDLLSSSKEKLVYEPQRKQTIDTF